MSQPDAADLNSNAPLPLRIKLLFDAQGGNCLPMAHVETVTASEDLTNGEPRQPLALRAIRSLLGDGLIEVGQIVGASDERIDFWGLSPSETIERIRELYIDHHGEPHLWDFIIWLGLTPAGEQLVGELKAQAAKETMPRHNGCGAPAPLQVDGLRP